MVFHIHVLAIFTKGAAMISTLALSPSSTSFGTLFLADTVIIPCGEYWLIYQSEVRKILYSEPLKLRTTFSELTFFDRMLESNILCDHLLIDILSV